MTLVDVVVSDPATGVVVAHLWGARDLVDEKAKAIAATIPTLTIKRTETEVPDEPQ